MANTTTALLVSGDFNLNQLVNKELKTNVSNMFKATRGMNKDVWMYAIAVHNIMDGELFVDDFKSLRNFAKAVDVSASTLSKYSSAVDFITNVLPAYGYDMTKLSYAITYLLSTLGEDFEAFMVEQSGTDFSKIAKSQLEALIKRFKARNTEEGSDSSADGEDSSEASELPEEMDDGELVVKGNDIVYAEMYDNVKEMHFEYNGMLYIIPYADLLHYQVAEVSGMYEEVE